MKFLIRLGLVGLALVVLLTAAVFLFLDDGVRRAVEVGGTHTLGLETRLEAVEISLLGSSVSMSGLSVANPPGYDEASFLELRQGSVDLPLTDLTSRVVRVPEVELLGVGLHIENGPEGRNYKKVLDSLERFRKAKKEGGEDAGGTGASSGGGMRFVIERLVIDEVDVSIDLVPGDGGLTRTGARLPRIELNDVGNDQGGMTTSELIAYVVEHLLGATLKLGPDQVPLEMLEELKDRLRDVNAIKDALLKDGGVLENLGVDDKTRDAVKDAVDIFDALRKKD